MILAASRRVKRVLWLTFGGLALAVAALFRPGPEDVAARADVALPPSELADVRVKHEIIEIPIAPPPTALARRSLRSPAGAPTERTPPPRSDSTPDAVRTARADDAADDSGRSDNVLLRAGRAIVGDGKHRPEPFPRIKKH